MDLMYSRIRGLEEGTLDWMIALMSPCARWVYVCLMRSSREILTVVTGGLLRKDSLDGLGGFIILNTNRLIFIEDTTPFIYCDSGPTAIFYKAKLLCGWQIKPKALTSIGILFIHIIGPDSYVQLWLLLR